MSKTKKVLSMMLAFGMAASMGTSAFANTPMTTEMDTLDSLVAAGSVLNSNKSEDAMVDGNTVFDDIIPLYDTNDNVVAHYVKLAPSGYAVVNNNKDNPAVIEFGETSNELIEEILISSITPKIIYNNPLDVYDANSLQALSRNNNESFYDMYPDLATPNPSLSAQNQEFKETLLAEQNQGRSVTNEGFGFINWDEMPTDDYSADTILYATSTDWAKMSDYNDIADNHCGATALTNLAMYFDRRGYDGLAINDSKDDTFEEFHSRVDDGPEITLASDAVDYFKDYGNHTLKYDTIGATFTNLKDAISQDRICGMLMIDNPISWHWILGVGYRDYSNGSDYIRIHNGWQYTVDRYYRPGYGSAWNSLTEYWVE
ncbi:MAG: hypothetical protein R3Y24_16620 [Eubacteriales bacterium]